VKKRILCVGLLCVDVAVEMPDMSRANVSDLQYASHIEMNLGGDACNQALDLQFLGYEPELAYLHGQGMLNDFVKNYLASLRIPVHSLGNLLQDDLTISIVQLQQNGERTFTSTKPEAGVLVLPATLDWHAFGVLSLGSIGFPPLDNSAFVHNLLSEAKRYGLVTVADTLLGDFSELSDYADIWPLLDYFLPSEAEACALASANDYEEAARAFLQAGVSQVVIKRGENGCYYQYAGKSGHVPALVTETPVDTTGAGDGFVAGFITGIMQSEAVEAACRRGAEVAAQVIMQRGGHLS